MKQGFERGHKEMAGAYGLDKALKPKVKRLPAGRKMSKPKASKGYGRKK